MRHNMAGVPYPFYQIHPQTPSPGTLYWEMAGKTLPCTWLWHMTLRQSWPDIRAGPWHTFCKGPRLREIKPPRIERITPVPVYHASMLDSVTLDVALTWTTRNVSNDACIRVYYEVTRGWHVHASRACIIVYYLDEQSHVQTCINTDMVTCTYCCAFMQCTDSEIESFIYGQKLSEVLRAKLEKSVLMICLSWAGHSKGELLPHEALRFIVKI
jgi:hypothetical protein